MQSLLEVPPRSLARLMTVLPKPIKRVAREGLHAANALRYQGNARYCACCDGTFSRFLAFGVAPQPMRENALCPRCESLERQRLTALYLESIPDFRTASRAMLHVAPEFCLQRKFRAMRNVRCTSVDLSSPLADQHVDITAMPFPDASFDLIICSHVLEHLVDDAKAMRELHRVLMPQGIAILQVPIDLSRANTDEDPSVTDPADRLRRWAQSDHVRIYGRDYVDRLREAGFFVEVNELAGNLAREEAVRCGVDVSEQIYVGRRAP